MIFGKPAAEKRKSLYERLHSMKYNGFKKFAWIPAHLENGQWIWLEPYWSYLLCNDIESVAAGLWPMWLIQANFLTQNYTLDDAIILKIKNGSLNNVGS